MANTKKYVSLDKLSLYDEKIKKVISDDDAAVLKSAKDYADGLATNYDAAGAAATAEAAAKAYADGKDAAIQAAQKAGDDAAAAAAVADGKAVAAQGEVDALEAYVGTFTASEGVDTVVKYIDAKTANIASDETVSALADRVTQAEKDIDAIEADYLKAADKTELEGKITTAQNSADAAQEYAEGVAGDLVDAVEELEGAIALKADKTALDEVSAVANAAVKQADYDVKIKALEDEDARIAGLVDAESAKAREEEGKLDERLEKVEAFFVGAAEDEGEGESLKNALDTLVEIQNYIDTDGAAADQMVKDIAANKKAIEDHVATDHDFGAADEALKEELMGEINKKATIETVNGIDGRLTTAEGKITTAEGDIDALEGRMTTVEGAVATKAEAQALTDAVAALEGADTGLGNRIAALEAKHGDGEGTVESLIATAKQEAIDTAAGDATSKANAAESAAKGHADSLNTAMNTRVEALEAASATHALASDLTALAGRVTTAEGEIDTLQTEMDAVEALAAANKAAHEANAAAIALKASQADLEAVSGRVTTLETWHNNFTEVSEQEINDLFK